MAKDVELDDGQPIGGGNIGAVSHLVVKKGDATYTIKLYDTESGAGTPGTTTGTLKLRMGGANHYARITQHLGSDAAGGATPLRYKNAAGNIYQVTQKGEFSITVPASDDQIICVSANGQTFRGANTYWFAEGTVWSAWVETDVNHHPGVLNLTGGTLNSTINLSVTPVATIPSGSSSYTATDSSYNKTFTVPSYINVLHLHGTTGDGTNNSYNVRVTPGKSYPITCHGDRYKSGGVYKYKYTILFNGLGVSTYSYSKPVSMSISWSGTINTYSTDHDFS